MGVRWVLQSARWCLLPLDLHLCLRDPLGGESEVQGAVAGRALPHQTVALSSGEWVWKAWNSRRQFSAGRQLEPDSPASGLQEARAGTQGDISCY